MNSYAISRVLYATPIWLTHIAPSNFKDIETKLRGIGKNIYGAQMQTGTSLFEITTNHIPLRVRTLGRLIKLYRNATKYFGHQISVCMRTLGNDYW